MTGLITSAANAQVKALRALLEQKKERIASGTFVVEGERNINAALAAGWLPVQFAASPAVILPPERSALCLRVTPELMARLVGKDNPQPLLAVFRQRWSELSAAQRGLWVALEDIHDPGNLGTIIRTAAAVGAQGLILIGHCCEVYAPESIRASVGTFAHLQYIKCSASEFLAWRTGYSGRVVATHLQGSVDYREPDYPQPLILLMGSESHGLSSGLTASADIKVRIPMRAEVESLNIASATAVMLYQMTA